MAFDFSSNFSIIAAVLTTASFGGAFPVETLDFISGSIFLSFSTALAT